MNRPRSTYALWSVLVLGLVTASCASDGDGDESISADGAETTQPSADTVAVAETAPATEPRTTDTTAAESTTTTSASTTSTSTTSTSTTSTTSTTVFEVPTSDDGLVELGGEVAEGTPWRLPALGGVDFVVPEGHSVHHDGDMVLIRPAWEVDEGRYLPTAVFALVSQRQGTDEVPTIEALTSEMLTGTGSAEPTGARLELMGREFEGHRFEAASYASVGPHYLFDALPRPWFSISGWQPFPVSTLFLTDTAGGVLAVGAIGRTEADLETAWSVFESVAPTVVIDDLRVDPVSPPTHPGPRDAPEPVPVDESRPEVLERTVQPIDAGEYTLDKLGTPVEVTVPDDWWVQGNFPAGIVVLTGDESFGPGDRAITFRTGLDHIVAFDGDFEPIGEPRPLDPSQPWPTDIGSTLLVESAGEVDLGGRVAQQFDVRVDPEADCSAEEPCEYQALSAHFFQVESIRKGYVTRVWVVADGVPEPITIIAQGADEAWLDEVQPVIDSLRFVV